MTVAPNSVIPLLELTQAHKRAYSSNLILVILICCTLRKPSTLKGPLENFQCNLCPMKFTRAYNLRSHLLIHSIRSGERPFVPTIYGKSFVHQHERKRHRGLHSSEKKFICSRSELSAQELALIPAWQNAPTGRIRLTTEDSMESNDSGYESALHLDLSEPRRILPVQVEAQTEGSQKALSYYGSLSSLGSRFMLSPPLQNLQDPTDILTLLPDRPETSEHSDNSLEKTVLSGDELECEGFSHGIELSGHHIDSQGTSESEGRSSYKVRHVSKEITFAQERAWEKDGNGHLSDRPEGTLSPNESSSNAGSENGDNEFREGSILDCSQRALIARLMDEIGSSFFYQLSHRPRQRGQGGQGSGESFSSSTEHTITTNSFIDESPGSRRKRSHKEDEDPEDEDDGKNKRPRNQNSDDGHSTRIRNFACPFHKFDASTYSSGNADPRLGLEYRACGPPGWPNIAKVK